MNRLSHILFAFFLFVALYSLIHAFSVLQSGFGVLRDLLIYYAAGGLVLTIISVPILYYKAPHRGSSSRTFGNLGAISALSFVTFGIGSLGGSLVYQWRTAIPIVGNISILIGALIMVIGAEMPDFDIPLLGISRHRNVVFHSAILPLLITVTTITNVALKIASAETFRIGAEVEYYITALFLLGYASHLFLDIYPSNASPFEIIWRVVSPYDEAPVGLKAVGPLKVSKAKAKHWLVGNGFLLVLVAGALLTLYFFNLPVFSP
ncbi:MAG: hypothetical protein KGY80_12040 [Candidatus Thorarchaeota archaeon]|nr:hypothetical protein [Candidatus Thorarchaeota archaeon]